MSIPKKRMVFTPSFFATALAWENPVTHPALLMCDDSCKLQSEVESWVDGWNTQQIGHRGKRERWTTNETGCFVEDLQHQCLTMAFYKHTAYNLFCKNHTIIWWVVHSDIPAPMHINDLLFNRPVNTVLLHVTSQNAVVYSKNGITVIPARGKSFFLGGFSNIEVPVLGTTIAFVGWRNVIGIKVVPGRQPLFHCTSTRVQQMLLANQLLRSDTQMYANDI